VNVPGALGCDAVWEGVVGEESGEPALLHEVMTKPAASITARMASALLFIRAAFFRSATRT
jgi:hypothetical protein